VSFSIDLAERKAECVGSVLEPLLGEIAIVAVALDLLQDGDQRIGLATIALQDGRQQGW
jgi:hypothetical protein